MSIDGTTTLTVSNEHVGLVALKVATGETSDYRIAWDLGFSIEYVRLLRSGPRFNIELAKIAPNAVVVKKDLGARLEDLAHDAVDVLVNKMHTSINDRNRILAAGKVLDARNTVKSARGANGEFGSPLAPGEAERIIETRQHVRAAVDVDGRSIEVRTSETRVTERLSGQPVLPVPGSAGLQGSGPARTSPCLQPLDQVVNQEQTP